jgi:hypothetical protein
MERSPSRHGYLVFKKPITARLSSAKKNIQGTAVKRLNCQVAEEGAEGREAQWEHLCAVMKSKEPKRKARHRRSRSSIAAERKSSTAIVGHRLRQPCQGSRGIRKEVRATSSASRLSS